MLLISMAYRLLVAVCAAMMVPSVHACPQKVVTVKLGPPAPTYMGCFTDMRFPRDLPNLINYDADMAVGKCHRLCRDQNAEYFGLQAGMQCWCGGSYGKHGQAGEENCHLRCVGNRDERCGGAMYNAVYAIKY